MYTQRHLDEAAKLTNCKSCPFRTGVRVPTHVSTFRPRIAVIGEGPGYQEEQRKRYFVGATGYKLDQLTKAVNIERDNLFLTNILQCRIPHKTPPKIVHQAIECCRPRLVAELKASEVSHINVQGKWAFQGLTGRRSALQDWVGCVQESQLEEFSPYTLVVSYHIAHALRGNSQLYPLIREWLRRTYALAEGTLKPFNWGRMYYYGRDERKTINALHRILRSKSGTRIGLDIETGGDDPIHDPITALGVSTKLDGVSIAWPPQRHFATEGRDTEAEELLDAILRREDLEKICHNGSHDVVGLEAHGKIVKGYKHDTILYHHTNGNTLRHGLQFAMACNYPVDPWKAEFHGDGEIKGLERFLTAAPGDLTHYNCKDTKAEPYLLEAELLRLPHTKNGQTLYDEMFQLAHWTSKMQVHGIALNQEAQQDLDRKLTRRIKTATREIRKAAAAVDPDRRWGATKTNPKGVPWKKISPSSSKQMHELLFECYDVEPRSYTDSGAPSLTKEDLEAFCRHPDPDVGAVVRALMRFRKWDKLHGTYVKDPRVRNGRFHPQWKAWGTKGGRMAAKLPAVQTIPQDARSIFMASPGRWFFAADKSQLELRVVAQLSKDSKLLEAYRHNIDVHTQNMFELFRSARRLKKGSKGFKSLRKLAKIGVFSANYGGTAETLHAQLIPDFPKLTLREVRKFLKAWYLFHPAIQLYHEKLLEIAEETDYVECPLSGRRQYFHKQVEPTKVYNYPIQGTAADIMNRAMLELAPRLAEMPETDLILQVHDELAVDTAYPVEVARLFNKHFVQTITIDGVEMHYPIDYKVGPNWGETLSFDTIEELEETWKNGWAPIRIIHKEKKKPKQERGPEALMFPEPA